MDLKNKKVLVIGTGISGMGAAKLLCSEGAIPIFYDENEKIKPEEVQGKMPEGVSGEVIIGSLPESIKEEVVLAVPSPGVPVDTDFMEDLEKRGIPVWGELELGYRYAKGRLAAITGTNGKTTTTTLVGQMMKGYYPSVFVVGNIGTPYTQSALEMEGESVTVAEVSSFQLETTKTFRPHVSAILNITPDHLNRHHTMENYVAAKERIAKNQTKEDVCVLNYEDGYTREFGKRCPARVIFFSSRRKLKEGLYLDGDEIWMAEGGEETRLMNIHDDMNLVGVCNVENVMAAILVSEAMGVPEKEYLEVIKAFRAVEHRIEFVEEVGGVAYYNDSKGTNPDAAIQAVYAMDRPTVLIGGGYDKGSDYDAWVESFAGKVKLLVLIGQTREKIADCAEKHGFEDILFAETFEEAFRSCVEHAAPGDAVLLSPACASWGMFSDYEERGRLFKELVYKESQKANSPERERMKKERA